MSLLLCSVFVLGAPVEGLRQGTLDAGGAQLRLNVSLQKTDGGYRGTLTSVDQSPKPFQIDSVQIDGMQIRLTVGAIGGVFDGTIEPNGTFTGKWKQGGAELPLRLVLAETPIVPRRPQEPKRPFAYNEEEITFRSAAEGVSLSGTLTWPKTTVPVAAIVLVTGSGPQDRDESIMGHKPFLVLSDALTKRGIAVLRYDDRGVGKSKGDFSLATTSDFAKDARGAVAFLKTRKEIDSKRIGLAGHSEGASIVSMVIAADQSVAFSVLLAPPAVLGDQVILSQVRSLSKLAGLPEAEVNRNVETQKQVIAIVKRQTDPAKLDRELRDVLKKAKPELTDVALTGQLAQLGSPWFRFFLTHDPLTDIKKANVPTLALFGERDIQVQADVNRPALENALRASGNKRARIVVVPGVNHLFQTATTGSTSEYAQIEETMAPAVVTMIGDFVTAR